MIDVHCHLLPGLDDGPESFDESLAMLRMAEADGVQTVVATPHFGGRFPEPPADLIRQLTGRLNELAEGEGLAARVVPGCEAYLVPELPQKLADGVALTLGDLGRFVLVEVPNLPLPLYARDTYFALRLAGFTAVLAHGERVATTDAGREFVREWARHGGLVQLNADSVGGRNGWGVKRVCRRLYDEGLFHVIASDGHSTGRRRPLLTPCLRGFSRAERETALQRYCSLDLAAGT